jgi:hypothetical protein
MIFFELITFTTYDFYSFLILVDLLDYMLIINWRELRVFLKFGCAFFELLCILVIILFIVIVERDYISFIIRIFNFNFFGEMVPNPS